MTPHQLQLDLSAPISATPPKRTLRDRLRADWVTWIAIAILAQVVGFGLVPAIAEAHRLSNEEERLYARHQRDVDQQSELELALRAQNDPIYRARETRLLRAAGTTLLTRE